MSMTTEALMLKNIKSIATSHWSKWNILHTLFLYYITHNSSIAYDDDDDDYDDVRVQEHSRTLGVMVFIGEHRK